MMNQSVMVALVDQIGKMLKAMPALPVGTVAVNETITLRVDGTVEKAEDEQYPPTISIPVKALAATLLPRLGATREAGLATLVEAITEALNGDFKADEALRKRMKDADEAFRLVNERLIARLPLATRTGKTFVRAKVTEVAGMTAEQVAAEVNPSQPEVV